MASYLEVKKILKDILCIDTDIDETCDITIPITSYSSEETNIVLPNNELKIAFDKMQNYTKDKLEISTHTCREVALQLFAPLTRSFVESGPINDSINGLIYSLGPASSEYCLFLLHELAESVKFNGRKSLIDLRHRRRMLFRRNINDSESINPMSLLPEILRVYTLKISSIKPILISQLRDYAASFEFQFMYKQGSAVSEYTDLQDMYSIGNSILRYSRERMDSPPQRIYNKDVLYYYTMAM